MLKKHKCVFLGGYKPPQLGRRPEVMSREGPLSSPVQITDSNIETLSEALQHLEITIADVQCLTETNQECDERRND